MSRSIMLCTFALTLTLVLSLSAVNCARILAVFPTPSISHQLPFRHITQELARRGHEVVVITTDPAFKNGTAPENLTEIDVHDISYGIWRDSFVAASTGKEEDLPNQMDAAFTAILDIFVKQLQVPEVQKTLYNDTFDLIFTETWIRTPLIFSHFHKVPVVQLSSFHAFFFNHEALGSAIHPILYPLPLRQKHINLTLWEKMIQLYRFYYIYYCVKRFEEIENEVLRKNFAPDMPTLSELNNNVDMLFVNLYPIWDTNRPVPPNVLYIGGIHQSKPKELPTDLQTYLDSSKNGVVYVSFGTNTNPSSLPVHKIQMMVKVFSQLPYDVLWKWDKDELPGKTNNIKISKWLPQPDLLRHPKIKVFITQAGLQSTDEALTAGVPLIGIPMIGDQWYNAEKYVVLKIGLKLNMVTLTHEELKNAIEEVIDNPSYEENVKKLRDLVHEQPQSPLERAIWWTEHLLKHGGGKHLRPPGANMPWAEYLELELVLVLLSLVLIVIASLLAIAVYVWKKLPNLHFSVKKLKYN